MAHPVHSQGGHWQWQKLCKHPMPFFNCERSELPSLFNARAVYIYIYIYIILENATALAWGSLIRPHAVITRSNLAVSDMYMSVFGKDATDSLYLLLCRYIRSQATHRYISRSAASYEEPISSYSLELK